MRKHQSDLQAAGQRLWAQVNEAYDLSPHEERLLLEACRQVDVIEELHAAVRRDGAVIETAEGHPRAHPAAVEARQARLALARLLVAMQLPQESGVPQRRGIRGVYQVS